MEKLGDYDNVGMQAYVVLDYEANKIYGPYASFTDAERKRTAICYEYRNEEDDAHVYILHHIV